MRAAVAQNGLALEHAAPKLQADPEVVLAAIGETGEEMAFASEGLRYTVPRTGQGRGASLPAGSYGTPAGSYGRQLAGSLPVGCR